MKKQKKSRFEKARIALIFWCLFIGIGAVAGGVGMLLDPSGKAMGMDAMLPYFQVLPFADTVFQDFVFSGIALLCVNAVPNLIAAALLLRRKKSGIVCGGIFGVTLMLWICIQFYLFEFNFMSTAYFIFGLIQALTGYAAWVFYRQEHFPFQPTDYPNIGRNPKKLVVYFSRMGYTRKLAYEAANESGAVLYELQTTEHTQGTAGFWWCGRFAMHGWAMPIETPEVSLQNFDSVTICSPIWVFQLAAPMRAFSEFAHGKIKAADYIFVHHTHCDFCKAADELDSLLGVQRGSLKTVRCHCGRFRSKTISTRPCTKA